MCNAAKLPTGKLFSYFYVGVFYDTEFSLSTINDVTNQGELFG